MKKTKLMKKWLNVLNFAYLRQNEISSLKSRISNTQKTSLTDDEIMELTEKLEYNNDNCNYMIMPDHAKKGIDYLNQKCFKLNGKRRYTKQVKNMPFEFFTAIKKYSHFTFKGFLLLNTYGNKYKFYMPVWRIHTTDNEFFDYCMDESLNFKAVGQNTVKTHLKIVA